MRLETSWDDGHELDIKIAELLKKYGLPGTFYITVDYVGKPGYLTWKQIKKLSHDFKIGSHTVSHPQDIKKLPHDQRWFEIQTSKEMLEGALDCNIDSFCYPRGRFDEACKQMAVQAGYHECRTTHVLRTSYQDRFAKPTTIHWYQRKDYGNIRTFDIATRYFDLARRKGAYFHLWGHSWEIDRDNQWEALERFLKYIKKGIKK